MAIDVASGEIIDVCGGRADLAAGRVRMVSRSAFEQDPVRLIRTFRMAAVLRFEVTPETAAAVRDQAMLITKPAAERIRDELLKILETGRAAEAITQMADCGLLSAMLPELAALRSERPDQKPRCDRFEHTLKAFSEIESLLADPRAVIPSDIDPGAWSLASIPAAILKFAMLLHELVRPSADRNDLSRFQRPPVDCDAVKKICARIKMSNRQTNYVDFIARKHRWPLLLFEANRRKRLSDRAVSRFFMMGGDKTPDLFLHAAADAAGGTCEIGASGADIRRLCAGFAATLFHRIPAPQKLTTASDRKGSDRTPWAATRSFLQVSADPHRSRPSRRSPANKRRGDPPGQKDAATPDGPASLTGAPLGAVSIHKWHLSSPGRCSRSLQSSTYRSCACRRSRHYCGAVAKSLRP